MSSVLGSLAPDPIRPVGDETDEEFCRRRWAWPRRQSGYAGFCTTRPDEIVSVRGGLGREFVVTLPANNLEDVVVTVPGGTSYQSLTSSMGGLAYDYLEVDSSMGGLHPDWVVYHLANTPGYEPPTNDEVLADPAVLAAYQDWWKRYDAGEFVLENGWCRPAG
jgi:hypothetical protein